jgi:hypothetical protein
MPLKWVREDITAIQFYYNSYLCKLRHSTAKYGGKHCKYYDLDY